MMATPNVEYERAVAERDRETRARKLALDLLDFVNSADKTQVAHFVEETLKGHRTLQQRMFSLLTYLVQAWAALPETHHDARNEYTVKKSKEIYDGPLEGFPGAPII